MAVDIIEGEARELSPEEVKERRDTCVDLEDSIKEAIGRGRAALWDLMKALYAFNDEHGWTALGYESQGEWLAQPEIGMSKRTFHRYVRLWKETVVMRQIPESTVKDLDMSKVEIVLPSVESEQVSLVEAMEDAHSLPVSDLREKYISGPRHIPPPGTGEEGEEGEVILGQETKPEPEHPQWLRAAATFESWVEIGGDKRKAQRNWARFVEQHPTLRAIVLISAFSSGEALEGQEEPPTKEEAQEAWKVVRSGLAIKIPSDLT